MGKADKTALGRALVKHHNHMIIQSKEKGRMYGKKKVLESVTEVTDIEAVIEQDQEEIDHRVYSSQFSAPDHLINLDGESVLTAEEWREEQKREEALHASSLRVPRRPEWHPSMSVEELDANEKHAFLLWRRSLVRLEENERLVLTPFEKNLDIWRQLWRVLERSDLLVMVVDARDPLFYRCPDLEAYAREIDVHKKTLLLVNKADLLPFSVREKWVKYFHDNDILFVFWSAKTANDTLEGKKLRDIEEKQNAGHIPDSIDTKIYGRDELLARLQAEAEAITAHSAKISNASNSSSKHVVVGFVGYPNVGKSSTINALVGEKRTGVTSTPGKTKHFQTLIISDELMLCDCPGLVFPSFTSSRYEMIASGVLPIDRITQHREAIQVVANRVPRSIIEKVYNISLPKPKPYESQSRAPLASELLRAYCSSRGHVASSGLPDETKAARQILKDYLDGKLPHFEMPPGYLPDDAGREADALGIRTSTSIAGCSSDLSDAENFLAVDNTNTPDLEFVLNDLDSFDMANGLPSTNTVAVKQKPATAAHKQHKKPQRKKDRSWRVGNDEGDGMPLARVFQKPINSGPAVRT